VNIPQSKGEHDRPAAVRSHLAQQSANPPVATQKRGTNPEPETQVHCVADLFHCRNAFPAGAVNGEGNRQGLGNLGAKRERLAAVREADLDGPQLGFEPLVLGTLLDDDAGDERQVLAMCAAKEHHRDGDVLVVGRVAVIVRVTEAWRLVVESGEVGMPHD